MKRVSTEKIDTLIQYFKNEKMFSRTPKVLALILSNEEWKFYRLARNAAVERLTRQKKLITRPQSFTSHASMDASYKAALMLQLSNREIHSICLKTLYEHSFCKNDFNKYDYAIIIREGVLKKLRTLESKSPDNVDLEKFALNTVLIHEFLHIAEVEYGQMILTNDDAKNTEMELKILNSLQGVFLDYKPEKLLSRNADKQK